jgi:hypothetical protein
MVDVHRGVTLSADVHAYTVYAVFFHLGQWCCALWGCCGCHKLCKQCKDICHHFSRGWNLLDRRRRHRQSYPHCPRVYLARERAARDYHVMNNTPIVMVCLNCDKGITFYTKQCLLEMAWFLLYLFRRYTFVCFNTSVLFVDVRYTFSFHLFVCLLTYHAFIYCFITCDWC